MAITSLLRNFNGDPNIVTMVTDDSAAAITTNGYFTSATILANIALLNNGDFQFLVTDLWLIYTSNGVGFYTYNSATGAFVALTGNAGLSSTLSSGNIFVGNVSNVATGVAMSGDATIANTGALTIANNAITTAKILNANVTLAKLAAGITPSHIIKFGGQTTTVGGSATEAFTITGAVAATDRAFVQVVNNGTNNVTVLQAVVTANTLTITFSGDPAADTVYNYQLIRAAA
jgi:hypothetical protein